jgi:hypothetical protein
VIVSILSDWKAPQLLSERLCPEYRCSSQQSFRAILISFAVEDTCSLHSAHSKRTS